MSTLRPIKGKESTTNSGSGSLTPKPRSPQLTTNKGKAPMRNINDSASLTPKARSPVLSSMVRHNGIQKRPSPPRSPQGIKSPKGKEKGKGVAVPQSIATSPDMALSSGPPADIGFFMLSRPSNKPTITSRPQPTAAPAPRRSSTGSAVYQVYVGTTAPNYEKFIDPRWLVILRFPEPDEDGNDCRWYHCLGSQWAETDAYRHCINDRVFSNNFVVRKIPVGTVKEEDMRKFIKCFKKTMPQESEFFCGHFLTKLIAAGILREYEVAQVLMEIGPLPVGAEDDPDYRSADEAIEQTMPDGTFLPFPMDL
ncbi:hypothetical protein BJY04DRAFT_219672 [Aspergillus karnatakaensis]|uniref:uncharacterized protein n=1 Tax=Aspergillus karnatakaensis TaxID=1810916 RepID=UPI003CCD001B